MADTAATTATEGGAAEGETATQRQARLRREKRQKKMAEEGEDRLARIKALNGGVAPPQEVLGGPTTTAQQSSASLADDPEEVDISQSMSGQAQRQKQTQQQQQHIDPTQNPLAAAMMQMQQEQAQNQSQKAAEGSSEDDPMVRMMEQMMGLLNGGGSGGAANGSDAAGAPPHDVPPMLKALLAGAGGAQQDAQQPPPTASAAYLWRIVHAVFAISLATYIALASTFNGTKLARSQSVYSEDEGYGFGRRLVLIFCTFELVLQSSRYFLEKGKFQGSGMIAQIVNSGVIPEPWAGYIRSLGRYVGIIQTLFADVMVVVFVFGAMAWWQGMVVT